MMDKADDQDDDAAGDADDEDEDGGEVSPPGQSPLPVTSAWRIVPAELTLEENSSGLLRPAAGFDPPPLSRRPCARRAGVAGVTREASTSDPSSNASNESSSSLC